jgi:hypothetical protein
MSHEQSFDVISWWNEISFDGKELFTLDDSGRLVIYAGQPGRERLVAEISAENSATVIPSLGERYYQMQSRVTELASEWAATEDKLKLAEKVSALRTMITTTPALGNIDKLLAETEPWQQEINKISEENYAAKLKLAEQAESLADSTEWKETTNIFKEITDQWKQTGHTDKQRGDKLWSRIETARTKFYERKKQHHEDQEKDMLQNLDLKLDLVEQAEALAASSEWKKTADTFHRLTNEWKTIGHTLSKKNEELWQRFIAAKSAFFDRKREHTAHIQQEQEVNIQAKSVLVEKAEALKDSTDWNTTAQAYATLMEEWKKTGRVNGEKGEELWGKFLAAQDHFFNAKKTHASELKNMHEQNLDLKMKLLNRAEQIKNSTLWGETTAELNELLDEWKKIGPVAREHSNKIWEQFLNARKHFFARKDNNREQRKHYAEAQKQVRSEQAKEMVGRLLREMQEEESKIADFTDGLNNITPGKKADELKKHLEQLIVEANQKLKRLKEKYEAVHAEYGKKANKEAAVTDAEEATTDNTVE